MATKMVSVCAQHICCIFVNLAISGKCCCRFFYPLDAFLSPNRQHQSNNGSHLLHYFVNKNSNNRQKLHVTIPGAWFWRLSTTVFLRSRAFVRFWFFHRVNFLDLCREQCRLVFSFFLLRPFHDRSRNVFQVISDITCYRAECTSTLKRTTKNFKCKMNLTTIIHCWVKAIVRLAGA